MKKVVIRSPQATKMQPQAPPLDDHQLIVIGDEEEDDEVGAPADGDSAAAMTVAMKSKDAKVLNRAFSSRFPSHYIVRALANVSNRRGVLEHLAKVHRYQTLFVQLLHILCQTFSTGLQNYNGHPNGPRIRGNVLHSLTERLEMLQGQGRNIHGLKRYVGH